ncbi:hypothetical protein RD110_22025 [Rhodoferax koreense]|uniref:Antitoxin Xre/MbcA/ParS-like toxin-binding domain-containing protein n=2 Tax=Rhodoferax koreensis TaxID=1842727 RepID=A0A1P8K0P2_9BURK|nr:hypothetical protein RD110_22025 [Rhodoferax koreense]
MFCDQPISRLARWIVDRKIVHLTWQSQVLVPGFQFLPQTACVRPVVQDLIGELGSIMDDWELTTWFALPNAWLGGRAPVDVLDCESHRVIQAARTAWFIARG